MGVREGDGPEAVLVGAVGAVGALETGTGFGAELTGPAMPAPTAAAAARYGQSDSTQSSVGWTHPA